jgi:RimJ/RimL family protein N-acetyltransferase
VDSDLTRLNQLNEWRRAIRPLLSPTDPADALASYYALWHDPRRTQLTLHYDAQERVDGFVAVCQTGVDLFRPLVTLRVRNQAAVSALLRSVLIPERLYQMIVPVTLAPALRDHMQFSSSSLNRIYILDPSRFQPVVNVLVQQVRSADGAARFQIESQEQVVAMSGTNWRSPTFAEVFVFVHPKGRGRGWGKSVVSAATASLLEERLRPLYLVEEDNQASISIATGLGYVDTGAREFAGEGRLKQPSESR